MDGELPLYKWTSIEVSQQRAGRWGGTGGTAGGNFVYKIKINNVVVHTKVHTNAGWIQNRTVYASDDWYLPAKAKIRNLEVETWPNGKLL